MTISPFPFASWSSFFSSAVAFICVFLLYIRSTRRKKAGAYTHNFLASFALIGFSLFLTGTPAILIKDPYWVQGVYMISGNLTQFAASYLAFTALTIFYPHRERFFSLAIWVPTIAFRVFAVINEFPLVKPAKEVIIGPFLDWQGSDMNPTNYLISIIWTLANLLLFALLFCLKGWRHENPAIRARSRLLAAGMMVVIVGWTSAQTFSFIPMSASRYLFISGTFGAALGNIGMVLLLLGVLAHERLDGE